MNIAKIRATIPASVDFLAIDAARRKEYFEAFMQAALAELDVEGREPDAWEAGDLAYAIGLAFCGMYSAAVEYANRAITPTDQRAPGDFARTVQSPTHSQLTHALAELRSTPAVQF